MVEYRLSSIPSDKRLSTLSAQWVKLTTKYQIVYCWVFECRIDWARDQTTKWPTVEHLEFQITEYPEHRVSNTPINKWLSRSSIECLRTPSAERLSTLSVEQSSTLSAECKVTQAPKSAKLRAPWKIWESNAMVTEKRQRFHYCSSQKLEILGFSIPKLNEYVPLNALD